MKVAPTVAPKFAPLNKGFPSLCSKVGGVFVSQMAGLLLWGRLFFELFLRVAPLLSYPSNDAFTDDPAHAPILQFLSKILDLLELLFRDSSSDDDRQ